MATPRQRVATQSAVDSSTDSAIGPGETTAVPEKTPKKASFEKKRTRKKKRYVFRPPAPQLPPPDPNVLPAVAISRRGRIKVKPLRYTETYQAVYARVRDFFVHLVTILSSVWGTGKTHSFCDYVAQCITDDRLPLFVVVVTPRISLATEDVVRFNAVIDAAIAAIPPDQTERRDRALQYRFVSYLETPAHAIGDHHRAVICSLQSLHKLRESAFFCHHVQRGNGLVFIDESEELAKSISINPTTGNHLHADADTLDQLCRSTGTRTMMCDAWPQESTAVLARILSGGDDAAISCVRNTTKPAPRDLIAYDSVGALCVQIVKDIADDRAACSGKPPIVVEHNGRTYTYPYHKFVVASDSKGQAKKLAAVLRRLGLGVKLYTSEATTIEKAYLQDDVLSAACDVFIFSPAITVGVDFPMLRLFGRLYGVITFQGCATRSVAQMFHRPRHPIDTSIACYVGRKKDVFGTVPVVPGQNIRDSSSQAAAPVVPGQNLLDSSSQAEEDDRMKFDLDAAIRAIESRGHKARAAKRVCKEFSQSPVEFTTAGPLVRHLLLLEVIAKQEMSLQKKHPRAALFRTLRYANIRFLRTDEHRLTPKQARNFARLHRFPDEINQPRMKTADATKVGPFRQMISVGDHMPKIISDIVFSEWILDRRGRLPKVMTCLTAFFCSGLKPLLKDFRAAERNVQPLLQDDDTKKFEIVWHLCAILGMPVCAPSYFLNLSSFSVEVDEHTEAQLADYLKDRCQLFTPDECRGCRHTLPKRHIAVPKLETSTFSVVTNAPSSSSTSATTSTATSATTSAFDSADSSDDEDPRAKYYRDWTHDCSDDSDSSNSDDSDEEEGTGAVKEPPTTSVVREFRKNPFYWTELALNLLYFFTNTVGSLKRLRNRTRPGAAARVVFTNELPKATDRIVAEFLCRERTGKSPTYDDAVFLIKPASPEETFYERFLRALSNPKAIDDEETFKNIFGMTREEVRTEGEKRGLYDVHKRYSWLDLTNHVGGSGMVRQMFGTESDDRPELLRRLEQMANEAAQSKAEAVRWRLAAADRDAVIERTSAQLRESGPPRKRLATEKETEDRKRQKTNSVSAG
jgi:hypothetical protein